MQQSQEVSFKRSLSLVDLTLLGFGSMFGSGWLFAASHVAALAGPASIFSWLAGGVAVFFLGLVYCELSAALPKAGGIVRYPAYAHGPLLGSLLGFITVIAYSSLTSVEIVAARQYAGSWIPGLTRNVAGDPTLLGWFVQFAALCFMAKLNMSTVKTFAVFNNIITIFKFVVPTLVIVCLFMYVRGDNFHSHGFAPHGWQSLETAISTGGIIFAYLGLTPIVAVAGEAKDPQRTIPLALILSVVMAALVYVLLQFVFVGSVPPDLLTNGWSGVNRSLSLPFHDLAVMLGLGWLASCVVLDAIISPSGTGNIYMGSCSRVLFAWAQTGTFSSWFAKLDPKTNSPRRAVMLTFGLSVFWMLPFPSWDALIGVVSSALVMSYTFTPVAAGALRRSNPELARPFQVPFMGFVGPVAFIVATLIIFWSGWTILSWLLSLQLVFIAGSVLVRHFVQKIDCREDLRSCGWVIAYFAGLLVFSRLGSFEGIALIPHPVDDVAVALFAWAIYAIGIRTSHRDTGLADEEEVILHAQADAVRATIGAR
ncbi:amino acid permease [Acetobacter sp. TBRC 12305]|uniref:APC family permease n=1 Tax=Acetobacter garciniae TaxID=2817435 RepID=A0A939KR10_9PROT|nr:APC family permease [Acetobacter garciniae]MBO1326127.1 APC family permease [Acetobacter garciniae]MBX0345129.1 amino acid permease [Acetobacter garciniae]